MKKTKPIKQCPETLIQGEMQNVCKKLGIQFDINYYERNYKLYQAYIYHQIEIKRLANIIINQTEYLIKQN